jgi:hypothetical protein
VESTEQTMCTEKHESGVMVAQLTGHAQWLLQWWR